MAVTTDRSESATDRPSWSRPPFEIDNVVALRHGADSSRSWKPIADRLEAEMVTARPWLLRHLGTVRALARVDAQIELIGDWLDANGLLDRDGNPRPASARLDRLEASPRRRSIAHRHRQRRSDALSALADEGRRFSPDELRMALRLI
jgi:hypothetical protein